MTHERTGRLRAALYYLAARHNAIAQHHCMKDRREDGMCRALLGGALVLGLVAGGCAPHVSVGADPVGPGYVSGGGEWNSGGGVTVVVRIFERGGTTVVCGAWATDQQSVLSINRNTDAIQVGSIYAGNTRLVQNLSFMAHVPYSINITGAQAECVASTVPWRAEFAETGPRVRFPRLAFPGGGGDMDSGGGGSPLVFRQTPRPDIVR
jgi:hypothetical protein